MIAWPVRKNAPKLTSGELKQSSSAMRAELDRQLKTKMDGEAHLRSIADDPTASQATLALLGQLEIEIASQRRAIEAVDAAIGERQQDERVAALKAEAEALTVSTAKLANRVRREYPRYAEPLAALLSALAKNASEWDRLKMVAKLEAGINLSGENAESLARPQSEADKLRMTPTYRSILDYTRIEDWDGRTLFEGAKA